MPATIELVDREPITYESAINQDENFINKAAYVAATEAFYRQLGKERDAIASVIRHHLNLGPSHTSTITVAPEKQWIRGSFNVCIPVEVGPPLWAGDDSGPQKLLLRCPFPFKLAEARYPGTVDEKLGCEVGAYAWMQDICSDVRIPQLYGFGFSEQRQGAQFTHESLRPFYIRATQTLRRLAYWLLGYPMLSHYTHHPAGPNGRLSTAYILLEHIGPETGRMLSNTWDKQRQEPERRQRLFQGLARIMFSLARVPQPRIGAFQFHDDGTITLTNRPLTCTTMILENDNTPRTIGQHETFACADAFASDMLSFHDGRFLSHPNAVYDAADCRGQMAARVVLRILLHRYADPSCRAGPFVLQLTDLHASNILVDDDWNVTCLIDLEWVCSLPAALLAVPYWLTGRGIDQITGTHLVEFDEVRREFLRIFEQEERTMAATASHGIILSEVMRHTWESGAVWFWYSIMSLNAMFSLVNDHLCPQFSIDLYLSKVTGTLSSLWCVGAHTVVEKKVIEYHDYEAKLRRLFGEEKECCPLDKQTSPGDAK